MDGIRRLVDVFHSVTPDFFFFLTSNDKMRTYLLEIYNWDIGPKALISFRFTYRQALLFILLLSDLYDDIIYEQKVQPEFHIDVCIHRAVSKYLQTLFIKESERGRTSLSMDSLLVGKTRKEASRMFFETLVRATPETFFFF